ncbi:MAG: branched-chain amino acid ABC transporter permease [Proteobacteria bacterium]|nr:branched-chain amino acid ABC transporter permease [Pseudomonadota bacterium]MBU4276661.1 branched-chain amino acid ABC transporter permease [Pseudomonadota bacterium]MBU4382262.1 branched-chain amino acid ABC transporter permease [Pseudomonadota bacterium]MCG2765928.1 branched-chain amino acid ABC transporter permease [Desulfarculaceae bacterium]
MQDFLQLMVTGLVIGSVYALVAMGFALIYKSTSIINFAQGEFVLVGGYICWWLYTMLGIPIVWSFMLTMLIAVAMGVVLERLVLRPMIGEPIISVIMITIALATVLKSLVTILWGTQIKVFTPAIFSQKAIHMGPILISEVYLWTFGFAFLFLGVFAAFFKFTRVGISMRAVANDQQVAQSMGISVKKVFAISWSIGALVSAVGGLLVGNINGINITLSDFGLKVFPAVILGGLDSIGGAIIGGLTIGILENIMGSYLDVYLGGGVKEIAPFIVLIIILMVKPYGLFGIKEIERV